MTVKSIIRNAFLGITCSALLCGCAGDTKVIEGEVKTLSVESNTPKAVQEEQPEQPVKNYKGYTFIYNDVVIAVDTEAAPIIEQLGEANSYFEAPSCAFEGIDKVYTYNSFELDTCPVNDTDVISAVIFKDDAVITSEGIGIGDSVDKVTETYGTDKTDENGMIIYEKDGMKLCFIIQDDKVISVEYRSAVLEES